MCWHHSQQWAVAQGLPRGQQLVLIKSRTAVQKTMKNIPSCGIHIQADLWTITTVQEYSPWDRELSCSDLQGRHFVQRTKCQVTGSNRVYLIHSSLLHKQADSRPAAQIACKTFFCIGVFSFFPCIFTICATMEPFDLETLLHKMYATRVLESHSWVHLKFICWVNFLCASYFSVSHKIIIHFYLGN